jgi:hypothetical protein
MGGPLRVKILANFHRPNGGAPTLQPSDLRPLVAILRQIARGHSLGFSPGGVQYEQQRVIYRQVIRNAWICRPRRRGIRGACGNSRLPQLQDPLSGNHFLTGLLGAEQVRRPRAGRHCDRGAEVMLGKGSPRTS